MLSPTMIVKVKLACCRNSSSFRPISYCGFSPVPVSPMTAKRVESFASGNVTFCAAVARTPPRRRRESRQRRDGRFCGSWVCFSAGGLCGGRRDHIGNEVDDEVGFDVAQDQMAAEKPILEFHWQRRQLEQQARRHGGQRHLSRIVRIDGRRHLHGHLGQDGLLVFERPCTEIPGHDFANLLSGGSRKYVALMSPGAFASN